MASGLRNSIGAVFSAFGESRVLILGATQTIGYGTLFYAYGVLAPTIASDMGVSLDRFFAIFTIGLLLGGLAAPFVGRALDVRGAGPIMAIGSLAAGLSLLICALAPNIYVFAAGVLLMEVAACMVLYEAAFAGLAQAHGHEARKRITAVTLIAGFASTIFWPLTQAMLNAFGWRTTYVIFALAHLTLCAGLHFFLARRPAKSDSSHDEGPISEAPATFEGKDRRSAILLYGAAVCVSGFVYAAFPIHLLSILVGKGHTAEAAALIAMVMGPAQVAARIIEVGFGHRFDPLVTGRAALATLVVAGAILMLPGGTATAAIAFAALYGASQGLMTIARGTVPLQLFGAAGYATLVGKITGWRFLINAFAPFLFAFAVTQGGLDLAISLCLGAAIAAFLMFLALRRPPARGSGAA